MKSGCLVQSTCLYPLSRCLRSCCLGCLGCLAAAAAATTRLPLSPLTCGRVHDRAVCVSKCFNPLDPDAGDGPGALELQPAGVPQAIGSSSSWAALKACLRLSHRSVARLRCWTHDSPSRLSRSTRKVGCEKGWEPPLRRPSAPSDSGLALGEPNDRGPTHLRQQTTRHTLGSYCQRFWVVISGCIQ